jgi:arylformamidase
MTETRRLSIEQIHHLDKEGWRLRLFSFGSHTGTHVDAPAHMQEAGATLDQLPLEKFIGEAQLIDVVDEFPKNIGLVFRTGKVGVELLPKFIMANTAFVVVGDKAELEVELERQLLQRNIITFTDLINLHELPEHEKFAFYGIPLKIKDGDGSPIRAFAIVD